MVVEVDNRFLEGSDAYIANQGVNLGNSYMDEITLSLMTAESGFHLAFSGSPGIGKTVLASKIMPAILGLEDHFYETTCERTMNEGPLVGSPELTVEDGQPSTKYRNGVVTQAIADASAEGGGIAYLDEYNKLREDVQVRLNSALDDRARMTRRDGEVIDDGGGFFLTIISYNPYSLKDLADSTADRFLHFNFEPRDAELSAELTAKKAGNDEEYFEKTKRGIGVVKLDERNPKTGLDRKIVYLEEKEGKWLDIFTGDEFKDGKVFAYNAKVPAEKYKGDLKDRPYRDRNMDFAQAVVSAKSLATHGTTGLTDGALETILRDQEITATKLEMPDFGRIDLSMGKVYGLLKEKGMQENDIWKLIGWLTVEQIARGHYRERNAGNGKTIKDTIEMVCGHRGLLPRRVIGSDFS